ncbi:AraC family transcriptional regulator [Rhodovastum atsumiense]|uniref:AraC family transcriptional regulator n=1 Tax=Rhodovastum atsumiense TaxID=504468 RepID=UPI001EEFC9E8|nr:AraC family transcriptional regulator [Rhodovastum atsumiense]
MDDAPLIRPISPPAEEDQAVRGGRTDDGPNDRATIRHLPDLHDIETLSARYVRQTFKPHAHDEYLFGVIESGVHAVWCRGTMNRVPAGTVVTMHPGDVHYGGGGHACGWCQRMLYVSEAGMRAILSDMADREITGSLDFTDAFHARPDLACRFSALHAVLHGSLEALARDVALDDLMRAILTELVPGVVPEDRNAPDGRIRDAIEYLRSRVDENVTLDELCRVADLRRRQTIAAFRRHTGLPPHAWHVQQKIGRVKRLLRDGMSAAQAAAETGFADQSHMARHFLGIVGVTPGAYARG